MKGERQKQSKGRKRFANASLLVLMLEKESMSTGL
jgi:hypothetical protein